MKKCFKCGEVKDLSEFYKHPRMADGHLNACKTCKRADAKKYIEDHKEERKEYEKSRATLPHRKAACVAYAKTDVGKEKIKMYIKRFQEKNPHKRSAHIAVGNALRDGILTRMPCEVCGEKAHAHHDDYSKPLDVRWLCPKHHREVHKMLARQQAPTAPDAGATAPRPPGSASRWTASPTRGA